MKTKVELLAPAGSFEKMKYAFAYGADAVYLGVPDFSLRVRINQFSEKEILEAVSYAHKLKKKIYVTLNIYAHNQHLEKMPEHILFLKEIGVDAIIASDPGVIELIQETWPEAEIHLSTQANAINWRAVQFWKKAGVKRIILAREIKLQEIKEIRQKVEGIGLEYFVHGAMCMSYSGRCILSKWMTDRSANLGDCSQPCRWEYHETHNMKHITHDMEQETHSKRREIKKGAYKEMNVADDQMRFAMDVEEDAHGTYFFNSYDMNLLEHLDKLLEAGVDSLKIEGRAKSVYYVAVVTRAYRKVLDALEEKKSWEKCKKIIAEQKKELATLAHRGYSTGFLLGGEPAHNFDNSAAQTHFQFVGEIIGQKGEMNEVKVHNQISLDDQLEGIMPAGNVVLKTKNIFNHLDKAVVSAHGGHKNNYFFQFDQVLPTGSLLRNRLNSHRLNKG